jgi:hypothetical protein
MTSTRTILSKGGETEESAAEGSVGTADAAAANVQGHEEMVRALKSLQQEMVQHRVLLPEQWLVEQQLLILEWATLAEECMAQQAPFAHLVQLLSQYRSQHTLWLQKAERCVRQGTDKYEESAIVVRTRSRLEERIESARKWMQDPSLCYVLANTAVLPETGNPEADISSSGGRSGPPSLVDLKKLLEHPILKWVAMQEEEHARTLVTEAGDWIEQAQAYLNSPPELIAESTAAPGEEEELLKKHFTLLRQLYEELLRLPVLLDESKAVDALTQLVKWVQQVEIIGTDCKNKTATLGYASFLLKKTSAILDAVEQVQSSNAKTQLLTRARRSKDRLKQTVETSHEWHNSACQALLAAVSASKLEKLELEYQEALALEVEMRELLQCEIKWQKSNSQQRGGRVALIEDMSDDAEEIIRGTVCWGKLKGFPFWPCVFGALSVPEPTKRKSKLGESQVKCVVRWMRPIWSVADGEPSRFGDEEGEPSACVIDRSSVRQWAGGQYPSGLMPKHKLHEQAVGVAQLRYKKREEELLEQQRLGALFGEIEEMEDEETNLQYDESDLATDSEEEEEEEEETLFTKRKSRMRGEQKLCLGPSCATPTGR